MCLRKIGKILRELPIVFSVASDILIVGYDSNGRTLCRMLQVLRKENLK